MELWSICIPRMCTIENEMIRSFNWVLAACLPIVCLTHYVAAAAARARLVESCPNSNSIAVMFSSVCKVVRPAGHFATLVDVRAEKRAHERATSQIPAPA